jgi:hypothetical protein
MRIIAFVNDAGTVKKILDHIGESPPATTQRPGARATGMGDGYGGGTGGRTIDNGIKPLSQNRRSSSIRVSLGDE